jgi:hypothetical protein
VRGKRKGGEMGGWDGWVNEIGWKGEERMESKGGGGAYLESAR